jgi:hypothetical protein
MQRVCLLLICLLPGCSAAVPSAPQPPTPQSIRFDGLYRAIENRGTSETGKKIYKLIFLRFLKNGTAHVATSEGSFDVEAKTRDVATEGLLSDARLDDQGSQGPWTLDVNKLKVTLQWKSRGRWIENKGGRAFEFDTDAEPVEFTEVHSGTVLNDTLTMRFEDSAFHSYGEYTATFVPLPFTKAEPTKPAD